MQKAWNVCTWCPVQTKMHQQRMVLEEAEGSTVPEENGTRERGRRARLSRSECESGKHRPEQLRSEDTSKAKQNKHDGDSNRTILKEMRTLGKCSELRERSGSLTPYWDHRGICQLRTKQNRERYKDCSKSTSCRKPQNPPDSIQTGTCHILLLSSRLPKEHGPGEQQLTATCRHLQTTWSMAPFEGICKIRCEHRAVVSPVPSLTCPFHTDSPQPYRLPFPSRKVWIPFCHTLEGPLPLTCFASKVTLPLPSVWALPSSQTPEGLS